MHLFLRATEIIDWNHPLVSAKASGLSRGLRQTDEIAGRCFEFVRDEIQHSGDFQRSPVTCRASQVLAEGTGWCYAKSHLLAALLRANGIPAGLCYQRLTNEGNIRAPRCLHGLNAVYLPEFGWYRVDSRGNRAGINAQFTPPVEQLAFHAQVGEEYDFPEILSDPLPVVVAALRAHHTWQEMYENLPDWTEASLPAAPNRA
ncbi:MAG TPA: transglutaminase family protein [Candidatus Dormibacteraeota bacterium]|nr:transglutaminase family protein [Candidatus Dormibacteraeota bacterium]